MTPVLSVVVQLLQHHLFTRRLCFANAGRAAGPVWPAWVSDARPLRVLTGVVPEQALLPAMLLPRYYSFSEPFWLHLSSFPLPRSLRIILSYQYQQKPCWDFARNCPPARGEGTLRGADVREDGVSAWLGT